MQHTLSLTLLSVVILCNSSCSRDRDSSNSASIEQSEEKMSYVVEKKTVLNGDEMVPCLEVYLPTNRGEMTRFRVYHPTTENETELKEAISNWNELWVKIRPLLKEGIEDYDTKQEIGGEGFSGTFIFGMTPDVYMGDKSDMIVSFNFEIDAPFWDFFVKGNDIVHSQPVF